MSKGKILLVAQRPSDYVEMRRSADALRQNDYTVQVLYHPCESAKSPSEAAVLEDGKQAESKGNLDSFEVFDFFKILDRNPAEENKRRSLQIGSGRLAVLVHAYYFLLSKFYDHFDYRIVGGLVTLSIYLRMCRKYTQLLKRIRPDVLVLPEDVVGIITPQIIKAAHRLNIPSLILPYTIANQQEAFLSLRSQSSYRRKRPVNWLISYLYPRWVMEQNGISLVRLPGPHILGHEFTGTAPPDPWMMNSGFVNAVAVENKAMLEFYRDAGLPGSKLRLVGAIYDDYLATYLLNKESELTILRQQLGITSTKPILTIAGCPDQSAGLNPGGFEYADMADFCRQIAAVLKPLKDYYEILVRPHPNYPKMGDMLEEAGFRKTNVDTAHLIALSDALIAFASATIRWAIACGIPVVNYDVFQFDYDDYKTVEGVLQANNLTEFADAASRLAPDRDDFKLLKQKQSKISENWGQLDGRSTARISALIEELRSEKPVSRCST